ncbi:hypothetical protein [Chryseolinea sp. H1M3-3]|nr:hypothetical protein [Chryseolinea sp. H1M3-3]
MPKIIEDLFALDPSQIDQKLVKLRLKFVEMSEQEKTLQQLLEEAIKKTR